MAHHARAQQHFTYQDYLAWTGDERWELLEGEAVLRIPSPSTLHQHLVGELFFQLRGYFGDKPCRVFCAPFDVRLAAANESDEQSSTVVQPDLLVICDEKQLDERGCMGAPEFIIEVLSPATAGRDQIKKHSLYERHGVREYWLVDPEGRTVSIYVREDDRRFAGPSRHKTRGKTEVTSFTELSIDWDRAFRNAPG